MKSLLTGLLILVTTIGYSQKSFDVSGFDKISLSSSFKAYVNIGSEFEVTAEGDEDDLEDLEVYVKNDRLIIKRKDGWGWNWGGANITMNITLPEIEGLSVSGSGSLVVNDKFDADDLELAVSGSGKMELNTDARVVEASISGSGKIYATGTSEEIDIRISGSGDFRGEDLKVAHCEARISGSGSCEIYATESIDAKISGSGSVRYGGDPKKVNSHSSGSGKVRKI